MNKFSLTFLSLGLALSSGMPADPTSTSTTTVTPVAANGKKGVTLIKPKPGVKHAEERIRELELLSPETNLVEPDELFAELPAIFHSDSLLPPPPPILEPETVDFPEAADFPEREGFITGHRIPIELFSAETQERLRNAAAKESHILNTGEKGNRYVNSANFRRTTTTTSTTTETPEVTESVRRPFSVVAPPPPPTGIAPPPSEPVYPAPSTKVFPPQDEAFVEEGIGGPDFLNNEGDPTYLRTLSSFF